MSKYVDTKIKGLKLRMAEKKDTSLILNFIIELADYENMSNEVVATEDILRESLFEKGAAEVILAEYNGKAVGFALFFSNFSTFLGKPGLYLEDLYVKQEYRGKGIGKILLSYLAKLAIDRDYGRFEWWCLDWNKPSIEFYKSKGAIPMDEWTVYRVHNEALKTLAKEFDE